MEILGSQRFIKGPTALRLMRRGGVITEPAPDYASAQIGDDIGGGVYGGTHTNGVDTWHLIFAKQAGEASSLQWGNFGTFTGATDVDDGLANQTTVLTSFDSGDSFAFYHCRDYVDANGNQDYYLPAQNELLKLKALKDLGHPEVSSNLSAFRWASTDITSTGARGIRTNDNLQLQVDKNTGRPVRPVRRVIV